MKNKFLLGVGGIILLICLFFGSYVWYRFFLDASNSYGSKEPNTNTLNQAAVIFKDDGDSVYDDASKLEDDDLDEVVPYLFQIENTKDTNQNYTLYIEDAPLNSVKDGCTSTTLLDRSQLRYQLKLNGKVIKEELLSNVNDNILDTRSISSKKVNKYELRIYIDDDATNWTGKHYHYKVVLNK